MLGVVGLAKRAGRTEAIGGPGNTATIALWPGWNLISFNTFPSVTAPASVMVPLAGQYDAVMGFDGVGQSFYPGVPPEQQSLERMDPLHGYWIKAHAEVTLTVQGSLVPSDTRIPLRVGWNLIPYLPTTAMPLTAALHSIEGHYSAVLGFDRGAQSFYTQIPPHMNTLHVLEPHRGYWLYVDQDTYLTYGPTAPPLGAQTFGELINEEARNRARDAGVHWPRMDVAWSDIEPNPPAGSVHTYDWTRYDSLIGAMFQFGWRDPVLTVKSAPDWAVDSYSAPWDDDSNPATPDVQHRGGPIDDADLPNFDAFLSALVGRYAPDGDWAKKQRGLPAGVGVRFWEIYNESDNQSLDPLCAVVGGLWGADLDSDGMPDTQEYAELLRRAYPVIKAANPQAQVVFSGLAYDVIPEDCFNMDFLDSVLTYLQTNYASETDYPFFDLMSFHQYDRWRNSWDGTGTGTLPYNQGLLAKAVQSHPGANFPGHPHYPAIREVLAAHGLQDIPLVVSEVSLSSSRSAGDNELQARHTVHEYVRAMTLWPDDLFAAMWFTLQNNTYGLLELDTAQPYPAYYAYTWLGQELDGYRFETQLGPEAASAGGTGSIYVQAYRFRHRDGRRKLVLWTDDGKGLQYNPLYGESPPSAQDMHIDVALGPLQLGQPTTPPLTVRVTDSTSYPALAAQTIVDGGTGDVDGSLNGWVTLQITQDPVYVEAVAP